MAGRPKGIPKTGGRKPDTPNKVTRETKEVIADLLKLTVPIYAEKMIEKANSKNPDEVNEFMTRIEKLIEFDVPKLSRSEVKNEIDLGQQQLFIKVDAKDIDLSL